MEKHQNYIINNANDLREIYAYSNLPPKISIIIKAFIFINGDENDIQKIKNINQKFRNLIQNHGLDTKKILLQMSEY